MNLRQNWRIVALILLLFVSFSVLFIPGIGLGSSSQGAVVDEGPTNLQFGLDLSGGTRIRAPMVGMTAEGVDVTVNNRADLATSVADNIPNVTRGDVLARPATDTIEVFGYDNLDAYRQVLTDQNIAYEEVRQGVTGPTREEGVEVLRDKIDESGLAGGTVQEVSTPAGEYFLVIEIPNRNRSEVEALVSQRGQVELVAHFPVSDGGDEQTYRDVTVITGEDIANVGQAQGPTPGVPNPHVPVVLTEDAAESFARQMIEFGFTREGAGACPPDAPENPTGYCLYTVLDGEVVHAAAMSPNLADGIESGEFSRSQNFVMTTANISDARDLQVNLRAGALPAPLDLEDRGTSDFIAPSLAQEFKLFSLITGIIAVFGVSGVVFVRYGNPRVALPMIVTALSEVVILLGFSAVVGLALNLSHIAGLIAVIGTGVDDLIIIADGVLAQGDVHSDRVFDNRFRKAFWVIGVAAMTTIIAMSPLAMLSLGDLRGFAIITILGVVVGVAITRPAYGDILRNLMTSVDN